LTLSIHHYEISLLGLKNSPMQYACFVAKWERKKGNDDDDDDDGD